MPAKAKRGRSMGRRLRRLAASLLAGALFLAFLGSITAAAITISQRHRSLDDLVRDALHFFEPQWHTNPKFTPQVSDITIQRQQQLDDPGLRRIEYSWRETMRGATSDCQGTLMAKAYGDIFGGWRDVGLLYLGCGEKRGPTPFSYTFWQSLPLELPRQYSFYVIGSRGRVAQIDVVLSDGSRERADIVEREFHALVQRDAPFQVLSIDYLDATGAVLKSRSLPDMR